MSLPGEAQARAARTYNSAADSYDGPATSFWDRFGRKSVERLKLAPGARVLDVCCGSGASAIPAAEQVGPDGSVLGVDLAENLLALARAKTERKGLHNIEFRVGDMLNLGLPDSAFDAVICVFGIFFVPDIPEAVSKLWRLARPGGKLAITTWGPRFLEPAHTVFWDSVREVRPDLYRGFSPWDLITTPEAVKSVLMQGGVHTDNVVAESGTQAITSPDDWWTMVMGTGSRSTVDQLSVSDREEVRQANLAFIATKGITKVETNVVYAIADK